MPIVNQPTGPIEGARMIGEALNDLMSPTVHDDAAGGASINLSLPIPVFQLGLDDIEGYGFLDHAKQVGWRYLIDQGGNLAYADIAEGQGGHRSFASLARNANAEALSNAAHLAESVAGDLPDCEARVLDIPALHISALWLAGAEQAFIPYIDADLQPENRDISVDRAFLTRVVARAIDLRSQFDAPAAPLASSAG